MILVEGRTRRDLVIAAASALVAGAVAVAAFYVHNRGESPILVGDGGSIMLESLKGDLERDFIEVNDNLIVHAGKFKLHKLTKTGFAGAAALCNGSDFCRVELTLNDLAASKIIVSSGRHGKGLWVSSSIPFTSAKWNRRDTTKWILGDETLKVTEAKVYGTDKGAAPLCSSKGCTVKIDYSD